MCCGSSYAPSGGGTGWSASPGAMANGEDYEFEVTHFVDGQPTTTIVASRYEADTLALGGGGVRPVPKRPANTPT